MELTANLRTHYARVAARHVKADFDNLATLSSKAYLERMLTGLDNWVTAADAGNLAWGILLCPEAPADLSPPRGASHRSEIMKRRASARLFCCRDQVTTLFFNVRYVQYPRSRPGWFANRAEKRARPLRVVRAGRLEQAAVVEPAPPPPPPGAGRQQEDETWNLNNGWRLMSSTMDKRTGSSLRLPFQFEPLSTDRGPRGR
ncbi:MAG: hypothetical protein AcusKO_24690 [Acuticoccus sp.]